MRRSVLGLVLVVFLLPLTAAAAQQEAQHVYLAFYKVGYDDLEEWNRQYWEYSVPILESLREEGMIEGFNQWQHDVGSEYNVRLAVRTYDWASLGTFWSEYLGRLGEAAPPLEPGFLQAHRDEIWDIGQAHMPEGGVDASHIYVSTFQHDFAHLAEWDRIWTDVAEPILAEAMEEGILGGWVKLDHNTGGPHNSKVLYFFEEWDHIDDLFAKFLGDMEEDTAQSDRTMALIQGHDDVIWVPTSR